MDGCILKRQMEDILNRKEYLDDTRGLCRKFARKRKQGKYICSKTSSDYVKNTIIRNEPKAMTRALCTSFEHNLVNNVKDNPKVFWNNARRKKNKIWNK